MYIRTMCMLELYVIELYLRDYMLKTFKDFMLETIFYHPNESGYTSQKIDKKLYFIMTINDVEKWWISSDLKNETCQI